MLVKINLTKIHSITCALVLVGYPLSAILSKFILINPTLINYTFRSIILFFSLFLLFNNLLKEKNFPSNKFSRLSLLFLFIYFSRLVIDVVFRKITYLDFNYNETFNFVILNSLLIIFIPFIISVWNFDKFDVIFFNKVVFSILIFSNFLIFFYFISSSEGMVALFINRNKLSNELDNSNVLNPISLAINGGLLIISNIIRKVYFNLKSIYFFILLFIGFFNLFLGSSRGPIIITFLLLILIFFMRYSIRIKTVIIGLVICTVLGVIGYLYFDFLINNFYIFERFIVFGGLGDYEKEEARTILLSSAFDQFLTNPLFGDKYIGNFDNSYPHNLLIELLMATGILGFIIFILFEFGLILKGLIKLFKFDTNPNWYLPIFISFSFFLLHMTSGSLFTGAPLWMSISILIISYYETSTTHILSELKKK